MQVLVEALIKVMLNHKNYIRTNTWKIPPHPLFSITWSFCLCRYHSIGWFSKYLQWFRCVYTHPVRKHTKRSDACVVPVLVTCIVYCVCQEVWVLNEMCFPLPPWPSACFSFPFFENNTYDPIIVLHLFLWHLASFQRISLWG